MHTPWGHADNIDRLDDGILSVSTPSHGGVFVPRDMLKRIPKPFFEHGTFAGQRKKGWFEEDCDMPIAIVFFPEHFRRARMFSDFDATYKRCVEMLERWHPEAFNEAVR